VTISNHLQIGKIEDAGLRGWMGGGGEGVKGKSKTRQQKGREWYQCDTEETRSRQEAQPLLPP
jgi:hypothetical protein